MSLLREFVDTSAFKLYEDSNGKNLCMAGIFIQADVKNHNQRVYPMHEIKRAVETVKSRIAKGESITGEADHPAELNINIDRISHVITDMWMEGVNGMGKLKIIPTPCGQIVRTLLESGVKLGVSSRGSGNVGYDGKVSDFEIVTVDIVAQPSAPDAYPKAIYESLYNMRGAESVFNHASASVYENSVSAQKCLEKDILRFAQELKKM